MNNIDQYRKILDEAPEGATHWDGEDYIDEYGRVYSKGDWVPYGPLPTRDIRSLEDIRRIVELERERDRLSENKQDLIQSQNRAVHRAYRAEKHAEAVERRCEQLERERDAVCNALVKLEMRKGKVPTQSLLDALNKRDIEQQIKGIEDAIRYAPSKAKYALPLIDTCELLAYIQQLREGCE